MHQAISRVSVGLGAFMVVLLGAHAQLLDRAKSANLTNTSVTLSNPRISFRGVLASGNAEGSSLITIETSGAPSLSTNQLAQDDSVSIGEAGSLGSYTVASINPNNEFTITAGLGAGDADAGDDVISTQSATHTVRFTTATAISDGRFRILVPALDSDTDSADGLPDAGFFDFGSSAPTVTCPSNITGYAFVTGTATASAITIGSTDYHAYECAYSGSGGVGTVFDDVTNDAITINSIINPAPTTTHTAGTADSHSIIIQHIDSNFTTQDSTTVAVGVIETVRVTATVAPQITFTIAGVSSSTSTCGLTTDVTTTALAVPFGEVSLAAFNDAAQTLTITTNASGGYSVTALANDQLGRDGGTCTGDNTGNDCIRDSAGDNTSMSHTVSDEWNNTATKGFGYSLDNDDAEAVAFEFSTATGNCTGTYCARQFADNEDSQTAVELFSATSGADNQNINVCYRVLPATTNTAGDYENFITYNATATF